MITMSVSLQRAIGFAALAAISMHAQAGELLNAYKNALAEDPTLASAEANADLERERFPQALSFVLPQVEAGASFRRTRTDTLQGVPGIIQENVVTSNTTGYDIRLTQPLFNLGAFAGLNVARKSVAAAELDYQAAKTSLMIRSIRAYLDVLSAQNEAEVADREFDAVERQTLRTKRRYEVGSAALADFQEAQARLDLTQAARIDAKRLLVSAREALREITGKNPSTLPGLSNDYRPELPAPANAQNWVDQAIQSNPQILAADLRRQAAEYEITANRSGHLPTLNLSGTHQYEDNSDAQFGTEQERSTVSLGLNLPIYSGGSVSSATRQARARLRLLNAEARQAQRRIERQTRDAYNVVALEKQRIAALANAVKSSTTAEKAARRGQELGARSIVDVLNAQRDLFSAQRDLVRARHNHLLASAELRQLTGSMDEAFLKELDALLVDRSGLGTVVTPDERSKNTTENKAGNSQKSASPATTAKHVTSQQTPEVATQAQKKPVAATIKAAEKPGSDRDYSIPAPNVIPLRGNSEPSNKP